jgi:DNA-binding MurR/RpiR family transcriptional regulator
MKKKTSIKGNANTLLTISSLYSSMTKAEKKVADTVLNDPEAAVHYTVTDLSEKAGVGETSVIRFCRSLGFSGYHEFKLSITVTVLNAVNAETEEEAEEEGDYPLSIMNRVTAIHTKVMADTRALLDPKSLMQAAEWLLSGKRVHFIGVGSSGITAQDAYYRFMRLGLPVTVQQDAHIIAMSASLLGKDDIVFGISTSGSTKDLVDPIKKAKASGATVICLTSHARSPITQVADAILLVPTKESPLQGGALSTKIAQIQAIDMLSAIVESLSRERTSEAIMKTANAVADKLY